MASDFVTRSRRALLGAALASLLATLALTVPAAAGIPTTRYVDDTAPGCGPDSLRHCPAGHQRQQPRRHHPGLPWRIRR